MALPSHPRPFGRRALLAGGAAFLAGGALAQTPDRPMLTIRDASGRGITLGAQDLAALPWHEIRTHTRWTDGLQTFRGPTLKDVLTRDGLTRDGLAGRSLRMRALNEFEVIVPAKDAWEYTPILAREMNGRIMRIRDKGPLWLIYPRDEVPALQDPLMDERWIWQLSEILIE